MPMGLPPGSCRLRLIVAALGLLAVMPQAVAEDYLTQVDARKTTVPYRGSEFVYRNTFSAYSLDRSAELSYNPYYAMTFGFRPSWWFSRHLYVRASLELVRELTQSDVTTLAGETLLSDLTLTAGYARIVTIPVVGIDVSADIRLRIPASKASQARTMVLGIGPGVRLSRSFPLLSGLTVGYGLRAIPTLHRATTAELETPLIPGCTAAGGCDAYLHTGVRNAPFRLQQTFDVTLQALDWLGVSLTYGLFIDFLYAIEDTDPRLAAAPQQPQDERYTSVFEAEVRFRPLPSLQVGVGLSTLSPQLAPDSTYENPLFNRYSVVFVDLHLDVAGLVSQIAPEERND